MTFTSVDAVEQVAPTITEYVASAVAIKQSSGDVPPPSPLCLHLGLPDPLLQRLCSVDP
jgi:hypothetical protein